MSDPKPGDWAAIQGYSEFTADVKQVASVTAKLVKFVGTSYPRQKSRGEVYGFFPTKEQAERVRNGLAGVYGEFNRRRSSADADRQKRVDEAREAALKSLDRIIAEAGK